MREIKDFSILCQTAKAIQITFVSFRSLRSINLWIPEQCYVLKGSSIFVSEYYLERKNIIPT